MFVKVKLLKGFAKTLIYKIPSFWNSSNLVGSVITVPLKNNIVPALVLETLTIPPKTAKFEIKQAINKDLLPEDPNFQNFIKKIAQFYFVDEKIFYQRIRNFINVKNKKISTDKIPNDSISSTKEIALTPEQQRIIDYLNPLVEKKTYAPTLIHGVTSSGKTEIYKKLIAKNFNLNQTTILLLPEVSLCLQFQNILRKQLPSNIPIISFHSASRSKEKKELWQALLTNSPILIIGVHLPILLPIKNLGTIIVDEEHETGFQEKKHPKINSKEVALWRAKLYNIPIVLGSATPSLNSLYQANNKNWKLFHLTKRFSGNFPTIKTVFINKNKYRKSFWITRELEHAISDRLSKKEQVVIFLNRRGYSFFVQCKQCGHTFVCPHCSVSLTLHKNKNHEELRCHYCDYIEQSPKCCSACHAPEKELLKRGLGTQQVVNILQELFPHAHIERADLDTTKKKRLWEQTVKNFENGEIDILVGTQTITKGYHFPSVTLVGIIWADLNLHFPVFNASETTLQQLIQVAGRAGRQSKESLVIAQIMQNHPIFNYLKEEAYPQFCKDELVFRKEVNYPPFGRFVQIELKNTNHLDIDKDSESLFQALEQRKEENHLEVTLLGPSQPLVHRIQKIEIRHIYIKAQSFESIHTLLRTINFQQYASQIFIVPTS